MNDKQLETIRLGLKNKAKEIPGKKQSIKKTVMILMPEILSLRKKNFSFKEISALLKSHGMVVSANSLCAYSGIYVHSNTGHLVTSKKEGVELLSAPVIDSIQEVTMAPAAIPVFKIPDVKKENPFNAIGEDARQKEIENPRNRIIDIDSVPDKSKIYSK